MGNSRAWTSSPNELGGSSKRKQCCDGEPALDHVRIDLMHTHELTLGLAFGLGALHALEPGHGKTAMLAYFASERGSLVHPLIVGISTAISHSVSLIAIASMVHLAHHLITGDHHHENVGVTQAMQWISAILIIVVGLWMLWSARSTVSAPGCGCHCHASASATKDDESGTAKRAGYSKSALLGVAFGLLPCPSAMAAYFSSMSEGSPIMAYSVIGLFAAGIASSLTVTGILLQVFGQRLFRSKRRLSRLPWSFIRAGLITCVGLIYLARVAMAA